MPYYNYLGQLDQQLPSYLRVGLRTREATPDENEEMNQQIDRLQEPDTPGMEPSAPSHRSFEYYDPNTKDSVLIQQPPTDDLLFNPLPGGGFAREGTESGRRIDPFIYGGRKPSNTNQYLNDQGIAEAIKRGDIVINKPTQLPPPGYGVGDKGRIDSRFWEREDDTEQLVRKQLAERMLNRWDPIEIRPKLPDLNLGSTIYALTPEELKQKQQQERSLWDWLFQRTSTQGSPQEYQDQDLRALPPRDELIRAPGGSPILGKTPGQAALSVDPRIFASRRPVTPGLDRVIPNAAPVRAPATMPRIEPDPNFRTANDPLFTPITNNVLSGQIYPQEEGEDVPDQPYPAWAKDLPVAVINSILNKPSYGEGQVIRTPNWRNVDSFLPERNQEIGKENGIITGREQQLRNELSLMREYPWLFPLREGERLKPLDAPYGRPQGYPFALY